MRYVNKVNFGFDNPSRSDSRWDLEVGNPTNQRSVFINYL